MTTFYSGLLGQMLDLLYPPLCALCRTRCDEKICPRCRGSFRYVEEPFCHLCGSPINPENLSCPYCSGHVAPFETARSVLLYEGNLREAVLMLKFKEKLQLAPVLSSYIQAFFEENRSLFDCDLIVPAPGSGETGKINVSGLLSHYLKKTSGLSVAEALVMDPLAPAQHTLECSQRWKNAKTAFNISMTDEIRGKSILLLDDIFTTGATATYCTEALVKAGAKGVKVLTLARTPF